MENTSRLYDAVVKLLRQLDCWQDLRHLYTLAWMVVGLLISHQISLSAWTDYVHSRAVFAQSTQRRFSRWLSNEPVETQQVYGPLIRQALHQWHSERLVLALDTTVLWQEYCLIQIALIYRGRAIPIVWQVLKHGSSSVAYSQYAPLLDAVIKLLPPAAEVLFLADRGFADVELMLHLKRLGWHYRIRIKSSFYLYQAKHGCPASYYLHYRCRAIFLHSVCVSRKRYGLVHVALAWHSQSNQRWYVVSDEPTSAQTFVEYGLRFDIEEGFLDTKSNGFQLEQSQIRSTEMLSRLCLVLVIATLYLTSVETEVVSNGHRRWVDPHWFRGNSYLKIGWHWLHRALSRGWRLPVSLYLSAIADPEPAIASRRQADNRHPPYFQATTVDCFDNTIDVVNWKLSQVA